MVVQIQPIHLLQLAVEVKTTTKDFEMIQTTYIWYTWMKFVTKLIVI